MRAFKFTLLVFGLAVGFIDGAHAAAVWASHVGGTCVPSSATIKAGQYETAGFGVRFTGNVVGAIRLLCPFGLDGYDATIGGMVMSVIDADGGGTDGHVRASLRRAVKGTNAWIEIGSCDSNSSTKTTPHQIFCPLESGHKLSSNDWYWWDVVIERTSPRVNVEFLGISLMYVVGNLPWPWG
jgi:hypothetical protein